MINHPDKDHHSEYKVLSQLLAAQSMLHIFPDEKKMGEFIAEALVSIKEIEGCGICFRSCSCLSNIPENEIETVSKTLFNTPDDQNYVSISLPNKENLQVIPLLTSERLFGYVFLTINDSASFEFSSPAIKNFINMLTMDLENRRQKKQLISHKLHLEEKVEKRTADLETEIAKHKKTEYELYKSEEKFRVLYNSSPDMYVSVSPDDGCILLCNDTFLNKSGYLREEVIGVQVFKMYHEECMDEVNKAFQQFVKTGTVKDTELILKRKNGSKIDVSLTVDAVRDGEGKILYSISSWRDITKRKRTEEELTEYRKNLEELVIERTKELEEKIKELERLNELFVDREFRIKELRDEITRLTE